MTQCVTCGSSLKPGSMRCMKCGTLLEVAPPSSTQQVQSEQPAPSQYAQQPQVVYVPQPQQVREPQCTKSKVVAGILAILLGGLGFHKFYLRMIGQGILYLLFCWTYIPAVIGFIEGVVYLTMSEVSFCRKYGD